MGIAATPEPLCFHVAQSQPPPSADGNVKSVHLCGPKRRICHTHARAEARQTTERFNGNEAGRRHVKPTGTSLDEISSSSRAFFFFFFGLWFKVVIWLTFDPPPSPVVSRRPLVECWRVDLRNFLALFSLSP